jgi:uncharacterized protein YvpB
VRLRAQLAAAALAVAPLSVPAALGTADGAAVAATADRPVAYTSWGTRTQFDTGTSRDVRVASGALRLDEPRLTTSYGGTGYDLGRWTSPWVSSDFALTELIPSWEATTPEGTFVQIQARGRSDGARSSWDLLGRWASYDRGFRRTSQGTQTDDSARVATDTLVADRSFDSWQVRVTLLRRTGTASTPRVDALGAMVSRIPSSTGVATSAPGVAAGITLPVPRYSQMTHTGHYPGYGGGGEAWCSPTSLAMVLRYYGAQPTREETAWVGDHPDRVVDHVARMTYDYGYEGTGNWPFNTAYAATRVQQAFVTRFSNLRGVERFVRAGIPVITSITFGRGQLAGAPIGSTNGHLLVVVGFTASGDVVVNDPAASSNRTVRRTYDRGQFEDAWLKRGADGGSGGLAYVVRDSEHPLPARNGATSW